MGGFSYSTDEFIALQLLWDEVKGWGPEKLRARFGGRGEMSAKILTEIAEERGLKVEKTGKPWGYNAALHAMQRAGRMPPISETRRGPYKSKAAGKAARAKAAAKTAPTTFSAGIAAIQAAQKNAKPAKPPPSPHALFTSIEHDLGAFLRDDDRARMNKAIDAAVSRKIQELTAELAEKAETRTRLVVYVSVYDRLIDRLQHRIDLLRDKGIDPEVQEKIDAAEEDREDAEAVQAHSFPSVSPIIASIPIKRGNARK